MKHNKKKLSKRKFRSKIFPYSSAQVPAYPPIKIKEDNKETEDKTKNKE